MGKSIIISFMIILLPFGFLRASEDPLSRDYRRANELFASSRFRDAISLYQKLIVSPPHGVSASDIHIRIGDSWFRLGVFNKALDAYRKAITDQKPSLKPETQYWIGFCTFLLGRDSEAVTEFLKIPELYPSSGMWVGTAYYWAGRASERMGKRDQAAAYYRKAGGNGRSTQGKFALKRAEGLGKGGTAESDR